MPRVHKRLLGSRQYINYTQEKLENALQAVVEGVCTIREASRRFGIPFGTLYNKYKGKHRSKPGRPTIFTKLEELAILKSASKCADWGFPLSLMDIRMMAKYYLDRKGRTVNIFKNNIPGVDWTYSLLNRHRDSFGQRLATNIKRARAAVSKETLNAFYDNLEVVIKDLPSSNIFNYDESNLSDDPGKKRGVYRRGVKYPEKVMNHSKSCTTVMICGSADGTLLPPYVIFKSLHLYDSWKENGPRGLPCCDKPCCSLGTRFNRTASGWLDGATFRDWFLSCFLPHAKRLEGRKALIGDNLSSHMDVDVLNLCAENNIDFICLVPNSTHFCQPLDVGFFRPMKEAWRATLSKWKLQNLRLATVPKDTFAKLLKETLKCMDAKPPRQQSDMPINSAIKRNLIKSFSASGIYPLDREQVLKRLPREFDEEDPTAEVESALTAMLKEQRFGDPGKPQQKRKRLAVAPGCSISTATAEAEKDNKDNKKDHTEPGCSYTTADTDKVVDNVYNSEDNINLLELQQQMHMSNLPSEAPNAVFEVGQYVLAKFSSQRGTKTYIYLCKITETHPEIVVTGMKSIGKNKTRFKLVADDVSVITSRDIVGVQATPTEKLDQDLNVYYEFDTSIPVVEV